MLCISTFLCIISNVVQNINLSVALLSALSCSSTTCNYSIAIVQYQSYVKRNCALMLIIICYGLKNINFSVALHSALCGSLFH